MGKNLLKLVLFHYVVYALEVQINRLIVFWEQGTHPNTLLYLRPGFVVIIVAETLQMTFKMNATLKEKRMYWNDVFS